MKFSLEKSYGMIARREGEAVYSTRYGVLFFLISLMFWTASAAAQSKARNVPRGDSKQGAANVPEGQELVNIDFPEPTEIKDIIRAVALWTGKNVILGKGVNGKVQMISPKKVTKEEAYQAFLSALNVLGLTTVETGKVIKIEPTRTAVKGNLQIYHGSDWAPRTDKMITQIVPLKYIDSKLIQRTLSRIVSTNSMIAYEPTNTLIVSDTGYKVRRILAILELLDIRGQQPQVVLVPIKFGDAKIISQKVSSILQSKTKKSASKNDYLTYKITVDERSNSVVVFGPPRTIADVKALVKKFDFPVSDPANQAAIRVRFLDYADAKKLATTLSSLAQGSNSNRSRSIGSRRVANRKADAKADTSAFSPVADLGDNVKITSDESSNALLITGSRSAYDAINNIIRKLDRRRAQVYVESDILDVNVDNSFKFETSVFSGTKSGESKVSFGWQGSRAGSVIAAQSDNAQPSSRLEAISALGSDFTIGILAGRKIDVPGIGEISPGGLITLLKSDSNTRVLSSPHLLTSNNEPAKITVGEKLFYKTSQASSVVGAGAVEKVEKEDVDLDLEIKPNVSHTGNYVTLKIDLVANEGGLNSLQLPDVNKRQTSQLVTVKNGQTAVISGLVKTRESESFQKIPLLGDIPILGWLFRNTNVIKETTSLMIFLTPHIVYGANDLAAIYRKKVAQRDELLRASFGSDEDDPFNKLLPSLDDGKFTPDAYDQLEVKKREEFIELHRRDIGYEEAEIEKLEKDKSLGVSEPLITPNQDDEMTGGEPESMQEAELNPSDEGSDEAEIEDSDLGLPSPPDDVEIEE